MIADLKPYPEYKESGQAWIGHVPLHWPILPNRALFEEVKDRNHPDEEMLSITITRGIVRQKMLLEGGSKKDGSNLDRAAYKLVQPRDIAYNKMRAWQGAIGMSDLRGIISPAYVVMRLRDEDDLPDYFHYLYRTPQFGKEAERWSYGITSDMWSLRPEHFKTIYTPHPPPAEQAAIVRFVEWANGRLGRAIRAKRKVMALLVQQKRAIIHRAVTSGLTPSVVMKSSGAEWLGDIPMHWESRAFARLARVVRGASPRPAGDRRYFYGDYIPWVTVGEVTKDREIYLTTTATSLTKLGAEHSVRFPAGTLVLTNSGATLGVPKILSVDACANDGIVAFLGLRSVINPVFAYYYLSTLTRRLREEMRQGGTQPNLNTGIVRNITCPLPPKVEQLAIVNFLKSEFFGIDRAASRIEREIELLREYHTRLVSDVVTGKLNVLVAASHLPDDVLQDSANSGAELGDEDDVEDNEFIA